MRLPLLLQMTIGRHRSDVKQSSAKFELPKRSDSRFRYGCNSCCIFERRIRGQQTSLDSSMP